MNKIKTLKLLLVLGALYYLVGAVTHLFGLTLFPFYEHALYQPYHDAIIAVSAIIISLLLFAVARDPVRNIDSLNVIIIGGIIALIFMSGFLWKIDFAQLGAPGKKAQTIFEMVMLVFYIGSLIYLKPKSEKEKFKLYAAAYLVLIKDGQILLLRRFNTGYQDGNYSLVAGHLDGGETTKQCIIREANEEAGIIISPEDLEVVHVMHRLAPTREYFDIYLCAEKWIGDVTNMEPNKCDELKWYQMDNLPNNMLPEIKLALENISKGVHYDEFGWEI